jgi:cytochrome c-type biogenesis protein CcmH
MNATIEGIKQQLAQLKELHASGVLPEAEFLEGKSTLERRILELVLAAPAVAQAPAASAAPVAAAQPRQAAADAPAPAAAKPSALLLVGLAVGVVAIAAAGYFWKGQPAQGAGEADATQAAAPDGKAAPHSTNAEQIAAMTEKLAERLKEKPDDVEGWSMLARSYSVLGKHDLALKAYEKASSLRKGDPTLLADYADSLAVNSNNSLEGEPMKLVERALKLDPKNLKALYLAGTAAYNKKDYANAVKIWEKLVAIGPAGNVFAREVEPVIAEARNLAGMPPAAKPLDAAPQAGAATSASSLSGTVTLSAALAKQAQPEDTVFVFARAAEGSRMPLAILRKQVKDLPISFNLNDSMAMSPATALSTTSGKVIVGARVSKSGNAMPQPGDLSGQSQPVAVGASGLQIEIKDAVKP